MLACGRCGLFCSQRYKTLLCHGLRRVNADLSMRFLFEGRIFSVYKAAEPNGWLFESYYAGVNAGAYIFASFSRLPFAAEPRVPLAYIAVLIRFANRWTAPARPTFLILIVDWDGRKERTITRRHRRVRCSPSTGTRRLLAS